MRTVYRWVCFLAGPGGGVGWRWHVRSVGGGRADEEGYGEWMVQGVWGCAGELAG